LKGDLSGDVVGVAREIGEHRLGPARGVEGAITGERRQIAEEGQAAG